MTPPTPQLQLFLLRAACTFLLIIVVLPAEGFADDTPLSPLRAQGTQWVDADDKHPSGGHGEFLRVSRPLNANGDVHGAIYQPVTLRGGESYTISGFHKDNGSSNAWSEIYLMAAEPTPGVDVVDHSSRVEPQLV